MIDNVVIPYRESRARRVRKAIDDWRVASEQWVAATLALASELKAARDECGNDDRRFGYWLVDNDCNDLSKDARAALINIAEHIDISREILEATKSRNVEWIWREYIRPKLADVSEGSDTSPDTPPAPEQLPAPATIDESDKPPENKPAPTSPVLTKRSGFFDAPRAEEIAEMFQGKDARTTLSHAWHGRGSKQIWELIVTALDAGLITPNNRGFDKPNLSLLFPNAPVGIARQYELSNQKQRTHIRDVMLPAMIACRDKLLAEPGRIREILAEYERERQTKQRETVQNKQRAVAVSTLPANQQELIFFGHAVWPRIDDRQGEYDYDQIRAAIWTFRSLDDWSKQITADNSPGSRAIRIRLSLKWIGEYLLRSDRQRENPVRRIITLIQWLSKLMEKNPDGECKWPHYPTAEADWG